MKKSMIPIILCASFCVQWPLWATGESIPLHGIRIRQEHFSKNGVLVSRPIPTDLKLATIISQNKIRTLDDYSAWLEKNVTYQVSPLNPKQFHPEEFLSSKRGNCADFALLNFELLSAAGYKPHLIGLYSPQKAHAICAFEHRGRFYWFDNAYLKLSRASDLISLAAEIAGEYSYVSSFELDPQTRPHRLLYKRG